MIAQLMRGIDHNKFKILLSPINAIEFFQNKDELRREKLIYLCQQICDPNLLAEPETLMVDFVSSQHKDSRTSHLSLTDIYSRSTFGSSWRDIRSNRLKTFIFDTTTIERMQILKDLHSYYHANFSRGNTLGEMLNTSEQANFGVIEYLIHNAKHNRSKPVPNDRKINLQEIITIMATQIFCAGCTPFPAAIDECWDSLGINTSKNKIEFVFNELQFLFKHGPFVGMGALLSLQATKKYNAGNLFDCYHLSYLPYADFFITGDETFHDFRKAFDTSFLLDRIQNLDYLMSLLQI